MTPFGPYLLKRKLADGGMADLYLAERRAGDAGAPPLVIKMIRTTYADDQRFVSQFVEEVHILSRLKHDNIVSILDSGTEENRPYLVTEFIDGVDTATMLDVCRTSGIAIPLAVMLHIGIGTSAALAHAHQATDSDGIPLHIVHRDISPQNILLSRDGQVKLCDFGLAGAPAGPALTDPSLRDALKGKLRYLSPEQVQNSPVDSRSDLFSLGVVLFESAVGHHPVPSGAGVSILRELAGSGGYPALSNVAPWIPGEIGEVIDRALCFDKEKRFQAAGEMGEALSACLRRHFSDNVFATTANLVARVQSCLPAEDAALSRSVKFLDMDSTASAIKEKQVPVSKAMPSPNNETKRKPSRKTLVFLILSGVLSVLGGYAILHRVSIDRPSEKVGRNTAPAAARMELPPVLLKNEADTVPTQSAATAETVTESDAGPSPAELPTIETAAGVVKKKHAFGFVNINAAPWADVAIDGVDYKPTPLLGLKLRAGKHKAVFHNAELKVTKTRVFTVKPDETVTVVVEMQSDP